MALQPDELVGRTIGSYLMLMLLGTDSLSAVFVAQNSNDPQERSAFKVLLPAEFSTPQEEAAFQDRFLQQAQAAQKMHHEHIWPVWDFGAKEHIFYMVLPLFTGSTLSQKLANEQKPMLFEEIASYLNQLAGAIDYAHQQGIVHGDIKPSNVLIDEEGNVYLVNFGIAHLFDSMPDSLPERSGNSIDREGPNATNESLTNLASSETIHGTPAYMAPELFRGEQFGPAIDIYSLGVLLYQLVTGKLPFTAAAPNLIGMQQLNEIPPSPRSLRPDLPEAAEAVILKALAKQPTDRFASASALATAFDTGIKGRWVEGLPPVPVIAPLVASETQADQTTVPDVVPLPENPDQPNPSVLSPALASTLADIPNADQPTQANPVPFVPPPVSRRNIPLLLLWGVVLLAALVLLGRIIAAAAASSSSNSSAPSTPTTTSSSTSESSGGSGTTGSGGSGAASPTIQPSGGGNQPTPATTPVPAFTPGTTSPAIPGSSPMPAPGNTPSTTNPGITSPPTAPPPPANPIPTTAPAIPPAPAPPAPVVPPAPTMPTPTP